jgi:uncharacterized protein (DUF1697 family)
MRKKAIAEEITKDITTEDFNYRWNDSVVSLDDYKRLVQEHQEWVEEQEKKAHSAIHRPPPSVPRRILDQKY